MILILNNFCRVAEKDELVIIQLNTSCCKDRLVFRSISKGHYINLSTLEEAEGWNIQIRIALENFYNELSQFTR